MSTNRVGGPTPPESSKPSSLEGKSTPGQRKVEKVEKIKEISEVDDETKRRKFEKAMGTTPEEEDGEVKSPSPFQAEFYTKPSSSKPDLDEIAGPVVPSPSYSAPPPSLPRESAKGEAETQLPHSTSFWKEIDEPPNLPPQGRKFKEVQEIKNPRISSQETKKGESQKKMDKKDSDWIPSSVVKEAKEKVDSISSPKKRGASSFDRLEEPFREKKEDQQSISVPMTPISVSKEAWFKKEEDKEDFPATGTRHREDSEAAFLLKKEELKEQERRVASWKEREKEEEKKDKKWAEIESLKLPYLHPDAAIFANAALNQATSYLDPDTFALYYQMVGTIYILTQTRGISKTDIVLNSPSFANSKFYGATITIEKYATAPDSLNIRLSGTDEAVKAFNQNLPSLMNAFKNGNFAFRIGRLEVEYKTDRPIFRRKDQRGTDLGSDGGATR